MAPNPTADRVTLRPRRWMLASAGVVLLLTWLSLWLSLEAPWLGLTLVADEQHDALRVVAVAADGPAAGRIHAGELLHGIARSGDRQPAAVTTRTLLEEPDFLPTYLEVNAFFAAQQRLWQTLLAQTVVLHTNTGMVAIEPAARPLTSLPAVLWFQLACGLLGGLTGMAVWIFRPGVAASRDYALTGIAFLLITYSAAIYSGREMALPGGLFHALSIINHFGAMLFAAFFVALVWHYPTPLGRLPVARLLAPLGLLIWILDSLQLLPGTDWGIRIPIILGLLAAMLMAALHWRRSTHDPVSRAMLKWFLLSLFLGGTTFVFGIFVLVWLGQPPLISQGYAFGVVLTMFIGIALGITRYRLFALERWWLQMWLWLLAGAGLVGLDMALIYLLQLNQAMALGLSLALAGWAYFPLRQWLLSSLLRGRRRRLEQLFPELLAVVLEADDHSALERGWQQLLQHLYSPLHLGVAAETPPVPRITHDGTRLSLPGLEASQGLTLAYPDQGRRLFSEQDRRLAGTALDLLRRAVAHHRAYQQGVQQERGRIARDLHDDIGTRLLTLAHKADEGELATIARDALRDLRSVIANLASEPGPLDELLADLRPETEQRCEAAGIDLDWQVSGPEPAPLLDARGRLNLTRTLREAITNAIRHARPRQIVLRANWTAAGDSELQIRHDGDSPPPHSWQHGNGLRNMHTRIDELRGTLILEPHADGAQVRIRLPGRTQPHG